MASTRASNLTQDLLGIIGSAGQVRQTAIASNKAVFTQAQQGKENKWGKEIRESNLRRASFTTSAEFAEEAALFVDKDEADAFDRSLYPDVSDVDVDTAEARLKDIKNAQQTSLVNSQVKLGQQEGVVRFNSKVSDSGASQNLQTVLANTKSKNYTLSQRKGMTQQVGNAVGNGIDNYGASNMDLIISEVIDANGFNDDKFTKLIEGTTLLNDQMFGYKHVPILKDGKIQRDAAGKTIVTKDAQVYYKDGVPTAEGEDVANFGEGEKTPVIRAIDKLKKSLQRIAKASGRGKNSDFRRLEAVAIIEDTLNNKTLNQTQALGDAINYLEIGLRQYDPKTGEPLWDNSKRLRTRTAVEVIKGRFAVSIDMAEDYMEGASYALVTDTQPTIRVNGQNIDLTKEVTTNMYQGKIQTDYGNYAKAKPSEQKEILKRMSSAFGDGFVAKEIDANMLMLSDKGGPVTTVIDLEVTIGFLDEVRGTTPDVITELNLTPTDIKNIQTTITNWKDTDPSKRLSERRLLNSIKFNRKVSSGKIADTNFYYAQLNTLDGYDYFTSIIDANGFGFDQELDNEAKTIASTQSGANLLANINMSPTDYAQLKDGDDETELTNGMTIGEAKKVLRAPYRHDVIQPTLVGAQEPIDDDVIDAFKDSTSRIISSLNPDLGSIVTDDIKVITEVVPSALRPNAKSRTVTTIYYEGKLMVKLTASDINQFPTNAKGVDFWTFKQDDNGFLQMDRTNKKQFDESRSRQAPKRKLGFGFDRVRGN